MALPSIKILLVAYIVVALGSLLWQLYANEFFAVCEFNAGACATALKDYGATALIWPSQMFVMKQMS